MIGVGTQVGNYVVRERLGEGGMGTVWLAEHPRIGSRVAIKVIKAAFAGDPESVSRFFMEAQAVNKIRHHNIVDITDFGETPDGEAYYVMEHLDGESLAARIARGPLPLAELRHIGAEVADALAAAHERGILHRDLKPDNVFLLQRTGTLPAVKVLDFGLVKLLGEQAVSHRTQSGALLGTPFYMSPEQCLSEPDLDARTDVYSVGIMLYQMVTGVVPFAGRGYGDVLLKHSIEAAPRARLKRADCPPWLDALIDRTLAKRRGERVQSMQVLAVALREGQLPAALELPKPSGSAPAVGAVDLGNAATITPAMAVLADHPSPRRGRTGIIVAAVAVAAAAAATVAYLKLRRPARALAVMSVPAPAPDASTVPQAKTALSNLMAAQHDALSGGDGDALAAIYSPELFRIGTDAVDVFASREAGLVALRRALDGARKQGAVLSANPSSLHMALSPSARSAWITEELDWSSDLGGKTTRVRYLITQVAAQLPSGHWRVIVSHWARGLSNSRALRAAADGTLPNPFAIPGGLHPLVGSAPEPVLAPARALLASREALLVGLSARAEVMVMGSALGELAIGPAAARQFLSNLQGEFTLEGELRVGASPDGELGWAAANLAYSTAAVVADAEPLVFRVLAVLLKEDAGYRIVQLQFSLGGPFPP